MFLFVCLFGCLFVCLLGCLLVGWFVFVCFCCLFACLVGWLVAWLVGWLCACVCLCVCVMFGLTVSELQWKSLLDLNTTGACSRREEPFQRMANLHTFVFDWLVFQRASLRSEHVNAWLWFPFTTRGLPPKKCTPRIPL